MYYAARLADLLNKNTPTCERSAIKLDERDVSDISLFKHNNVLLVKFTRTQQISHRYLSWEM